MSSLDKKSKKSHSFIVIGTVFLFNFYKSKGIVQVDVILLSLLLST